VTRSHRHNAFTLLEVVLAIGLVLVVAGGAMQFYRYVARSRRSILAHAEFSRTVRLVMDRMTAELQSLRVDPVLQAVLVWDSEEIQFTTVTLPGPAAWVVADRTEEAIPPTHDMRLVTYGLQIEQNEDGELENHGLKRVSRTVLAIPDEDAEAEDAELQGASTEILAAGIKFLHLRYYTGDELADEGEMAAGVVDDGWVDAWNRRQLPAAIEITLGTEPIDEDMDVDAYLDTHETYRRVVFLPGSTIRRNQGGSTMRRTVIETGGM